MSTPHPSDDLLQRHLDGTLTPAEAEPVDVHLRDCPACAALRAEYAELFGGLAKLEQPEPPPHFAEAVLARVAEQQRELARQRLMAALTFAGSLALAVACFAAAGSHAWAHELSSWSSGLVAVGRGLHVAVELAGSLAVAVRLPLIAACTALGLPLIAMLYRTMPERALTAST